MSPYYQDDAVTLYHGDALALLADLPPGLVDAVITDPPYSSGGMTRGDRMQSVADKYVQSGSRRFIESGFTGDNRDQRGWAYWCSLWLSQCLRVTRPSGYALMFTDWRQLPVATDLLQAGGWVYRGIVPWDKGEASRAPHTGYFRHQCEYLVWGTSGVSVAAKHGGPWPGYYRHNVLQVDKWHVTGKPTALMAQLVQVVPPGETVLDPFAGSGTTGVAAKQMGRKAILCEMSEANCEVAARRLSQGVLALEGAA